MAARAMELVRIQNAARLATARRSTQRATMQHSLVRKATGITTAALLGTLKRVGVQDTVGGFPWKLGMITLAQLGEALSKGNMQAAMAGIADSGTAIYIDRAIVSGSLIAGGEI